MMFHADEADQPAVLRCAARRDPNLHFVEQVALKPPEVVIDVAQQQQYEQQLQDAANAPLPDEDDDIAE